MATDTEIDNLLALHGLERRLDKHHPQKHPKFMWIVYHIGEDLPVMPVLLSFDKPIEVYAAWIASGFSQKVLLNAVANLGVPKIYQPVHGQALDPAPPAKPA